MSLLFTPNESSMLTAGADRTRLSAVFSDDGSESAGDGGARIPIEAAMSSAPVARDDSEIIDDRWGRV